MFESRPPRFWKPSCLRRAFFLGWFGVESEKSARFGARFWGRGRTEKQALRSRSREGWLDLRPYGHSPQLLITLTRSSKPTMPSPDKSAAQELGADEQSSQDPPSVQVPPISVHWRSLMVVQPLGRQQEPVIVSAMLVLQATSAHSGI